ncbi:MAG: lipoate--protein ligase [Clostridia bacterium]|nr:lipoate--protein ligase [Clostridia bacterium]
MTKLNFLISDNYNPHLNLAVESYLLENADCTTLFLWKNERTVVIGANQNPYTECNLDRLLGEDGTLARRRTGGGAVYHDLGNLNFSFIADKAVYNVNRQLSVIQESLLPYGILAELSGRNDLTADGRKFSGNAFYKTDKNCLHHGTILIKTDGERLSKYLTVNPNKLLKKGVTSVISRIVNLSQLNSSVDSTNIIPELIKSFEKIYGNSATALDYNTLAGESRAQELYRKYSSQEYLLSDWAKFASTAVINNERGLTELAINLENNIIKSVKISSDTLYPELISHAEKLLVNYRPGDKLPLFYTGLSQDELVILNDIFDFINQKGAQNV